MFGLQVGKFILVTSNQFAESCVFQPVAEMLKNGSLSLRLFVCRVLLTNISQELRFLSLPRQPRLRLAIRADGGLHVAHVERTFFEDEFANELLDVFLRFEGDGFGKRLAKLLGVEPQVPRRGHLSEIILLPSKDTLPTIFAAEEGAELFLLEQRSGWGDFTPIQPRRNKKVSSLRFGSGAGVLNTDAPCFAAQGLVSLCRPGEFKRHEGHAVATYVVRLAIASGVR